MNLCKVPAILFLLSLSATNVVAQVPHSTPDNTIDCTAFKKQRNGWFVEALTTFNFGGINMRLSNQLIQPHSGIEMNGVDLYDAIESNAAEIAVEKPTVNAVTDIGFASGRFRLVILA